MSLELLACGCREEAACRASLHLSACTSQLVELACASPLVELRLRGSSFYSLASPPTTFDEHETLQLRLT